MFFFNIAIECQGKQHFEPIDFFGGEENFLKQKERDKEKLEECKQHGIKMIYYVADEKYFGTYENEIHCPEELISMLNN